MKYRLILLITLVSSFTLKAQEEVYELRTYELEFFKSAEVLHTYFKDALIPALNRQGINHIGAFEETGESLPKKIYLLIAYKNMESLTASLDALEKDKQYQQDAKAYLTASQETMPFKRFHWDGFH